MNRSGFTTRTPAAAMLAAAAASGLVLAGCGNSSSATTASTSSSASGQPAAAGFRLGRPGLERYELERQCQRGAAPRLVPADCREHLGVPGKAEQRAGTVTNKVISVIPVAGGNKVAMKVQDDLPGLHTGTTTSVFIVHTTDRSPCR